MSCIALTNVAACADPLYVTVEVDTKFVPLIVSVCADEPALVEEGDRLVIVGVGLFTVKFEGAELPPPGIGLVTMTGKVPADDWSALDN